MPAKRRAAEAAALDGTRTPSEPSDEDDADALAVPAAGEATGGGAERETGATSQPASADRREP